MESENLGAMIGLGAAKGFSAINGLSAGDGLRSCMVAGCEMIREDSGVSRESGLEGLEGEGEEVGAEKWEDAEGVVSEEADEETICGTGATKGATTSGATVAEETSTILNGINEGGVGKGTTTSGRCATTDATVGAGVAEKPSTILNGIKEGGVGEGTTSSGTCATDATVGVGVAEKPSTIVNGSTELIATGWNSIGTKGGTVTVGMTVGVASPASHGLGGSITVGRDEVDWWRLYFGL